MSLYCLKCGVFAYKTHKCSIQSLIPITKNMRGVADKLYALGIELLSSACFVYPVQDSIYEHTIIIDIELKRTYPETLLPELPKGWKWYTQTVTDDHLPLSVLGYSEQFVWLGFQSIEQRVQEITAEFLSYLDTRDKTVLAAVMLLMDS